MHVNIAFVQIAEDQNTLSLYDVPAPGAPSVPEARTRHFKSAPEEDLLSCSSRETSFSSAGAPRLIGAISNMSDVARLATMTSGRPRPSAWDRARLKAKAQVTAKRLVNLLAHPKQAAHRVRAGESLLVRPDLLQLQQGAQAPAGALQMHAAMGETCVAPACHVGEQAELWEVVDLVQGELAAASSPAECASATDSAFARAQAALEGYGGTGGAAERVLHAVVRLCQHGAQHSAASAVNSCHAALHICKSLRQQPGLEAFSGPQA